MKSVHYTCDRCGEPIAAGRSVLILDAGAGPAAPWPRDPETGRPALDLCGPCLEGLGRWLRGDDPEKRDGKLF